MVYTNINKKYDRRRYLAPQYFEFGNRYRYYLYYRFHFCEGAFAVFKFLKLSSAAK